MLSQVTVAKYHLAFMDSFQVTSLTSLDCACKTQHWDSTEPLGGCVCVSLSRLRLNWATGCVCVCVCVSLSRVWYFATPWTVAHQAPLSWNSPSKNTGVGHCSLLHDHTYRTPAFSLTENGCETRSGSISEEKASPTFDLKSSHDTPLRNLACQTLRVYQGAQDGLTLLDK